MPLPAQQGARAVGSHAREPRRTWSQSGVRQLHRRWRHSQTRCAIRYIRAARHVTIRGNELASPRSSTRNASPACKSALRPRTFCIPHSFRPPVCAASRIVPEIRSCSVGSPCTRLKAARQSTSPSSSALGRPPRAHSYQPRSERTGHANQQCDGTPASLSTSAASSSASMSGFQRRTCRPVAPGTLRCRQSRWALKKKPPTDDTAAAYEWGPSTRMERSHGEDDG